MIKIFCIFITFILLLNIITWVYKNINLNPKYSIGEIIDEYNGVEVYFNGGINQVLGRNVTNDNYNLGLKYQCVEFVKRYYYIAFGHKFPNSYGNAIDFFNKQLMDGQYNSERGLFQYKNSSIVKPQIEDILIYENSIFNRFGHVSLVTNIMNDEIEIIQQNPGPFVTTRERMTIKNENGLWKIKNKRIIGWLRKETESE
jgi:surface antigen